MENLNRRRLCVGLIIGWLVLFGVYFCRLIAFSFHSDVYTHIMMIPAVCAYLIHLNRKVIFNDIRSHWSFAAMALLAIGVLVYVLHLVLGEMAQVTDGLFLSTLSGLFVFWGMFLGFFGGRAFKAALFPMMFLLFMLPLPSFALDALVRFLQSASAGTAAVIFGIFDIPFLRQGSVFALPGLTIEVAPQCSGIRSCFALLVISLLASFLFLESKRRRAIFMSAVLPVTIFKNALRIVLLAYLGAYVDKGFITDSLLHRQGGRPFLFLAVLMLVPLLWALRRSEKRSRELSSHRGNATGNGNKKSLSSAGKQAGEVATAMNR